jgi:putative Holliday junction resolvase
MASNFLCFDYGLKRIGVAIGNDLLRQARELQPVKAKDGIPNWQILEKILNEWQPKAVIVGLPLNMDGSESELSTRARKFANRIHGRFHLPVHMQDERLSSYEAKGIVLQERGHVDFGDHSVDGLAACLVLESWFNNRNDND